MMILRRIPERVPRSRTRRAVRSIPILAAACMNCTWGPAPSAAATDLLSCENWNTVAFFAQADAAAVSRCLQAGALLIPLDPTSAHLGVPVPLHLASSYASDPDVVRILIEAGANLSVSDERGRVALHWAAARNSNPAVIAALLRAGAAREARDEDGRTPLHLVAETNESPAVVAALLEAGADLEARDKYRQTPLHRAAASNQSLAIVAALLEAGADLEVQDEWGWTPLIAAVADNESSAVLAALLKAGSESDSAAQNPSAPWRHGTIEDGHRYMVQRLRACCRQSSRRYWMPVPIQMHGPIMICRPCTSRRTTTTLLL